VTREERRALAALDPPGLLVLLAVGLALVMAYNGCR
jgi:hypothetical protein